MNKIYKKLRKNTKGQYYLLSFCVFLSVLLVTSFSLMYFGPTVQEFLPEGGDTRKMANLLLGVTAVGCFVFTVYASGLFFRFKAREYGILMEFLPEGGDTRKMANLLLGVTAVGCFVFTVYASGLFFRFKAREYGILIALGTEKRQLKKLLFKELSVYASGLFFRFKAREYGILIALGTEKRQLKKLLFKELSVVTALASFLGLLLSIPVSFLIWKLFELFIISNEQMTYRFGVVGFLPGILFACILACVLGIAGRRFINRSDIMEILRTQQKTEMVKEIKGWTFPVGVALTVIGILLGAGLPQIAARVWGISLSGIGNLFYLLAL